jgi:hypothetical protein
MQQVIKTAIRVDNAQLAFRRYNEAIEEWGLDSTKAIQLAASLCTLPAELDKLQLLINEQFIKQLYAALHTELEICYIDLF